MRKITALLIIILLLLTGCSSSKDTVSLTELDYLSEKHLRDKNNIVQTEEFTNDNVITFESGDGMKYIYVYSSSRDAEGNLIEAAGENDNEVFSVKGKYSEKTMPETVSEAVPLDISSYSNFIQIFPENSDMYFKGEIKDTANIFGQKRSSVVYKNAFGEKADFICYPTSLGINTEIIIPTKQESNTFRLKIKLPKELIPDTGSPDYILFKTALENGEVKSVIYTPLACDSNQLWSFNNSVKLISKDSANDVYTLEYTIDKDFLNSEATKYPVKLNQSFYLYRPKQPDTSAYSETGDEAGHYLSPYMFIGDKTIKGEGWTYVRYETLKAMDINPDSIVSARYYVHNLFDMDKEVKLAAFAVTSDWCSINTRWFNRPTQDERPVAEITVKDRGDYSLDITKLIKEMMKNRLNDAQKYSVQNSFMIKSDTPDSNLLLASGDSGLYSPLLEIVIRKE